MFHWIYLEHRRPWYTSSTKAIPTKKRPHFLIVLLFWGGNILSNNHNSLFLEYTDIPSKKWIKFTGYKLNIHEKNSVVIVLLGSRGSPEWIVTVWHGCGHVQDWTDSFPMVIPNPYFVERLKTDSKMLLHKLKYDFINNWTVYAMTNIFLLTDK